MAIVDAFIAMAYNVVRFRHQERGQWGIIRDRVITPIEGEFATTDDFIR